MTNRMKIYLLVVAIIALAGTAMYAQNTAGHDVTMNVNRITRLGVTAPATAVALSVQDPTNAGDAPQGDTDSSKHLQYTVVTAGTEYITVQVDDVANILAGCSLSVLASGFDANEGAAPGTVTLTAVAQNLITGITSVATGATGTDGPTITFTLNVVTPADLVALDTATALVTYTMVL